MDWRLSFNQKPDNPQKLKALTLVSWYWFNVIPILSTIKLKIGFPFEKGIKARTVVIKAGIPYFNMSII